MKPFVSIIIPVYNAGNFLDKCLNSLFEQSYSNIQLIFINDCSTDSSFIILTEFKNKVLQYRPSFSIDIISHDINKGVASSRNTGLSSVTSKYIYYVDADDYLVKDAIEKLVSKAESENADIVGCDWVLKFKKTGRGMRQPSVTSGSLATEYMAKGVMRWNLWLFLVKTEIYQKNNIAFKPGLNMGEDMYVMFKLMYYANKVIMIDSPLYYYNQGNTNSLTKVYSLEHKKEVSEHIYLLEEFYLQNRKNKDHLELLNYLKLNIKLPLLVSNKVNQYKEWKSWFPEANNYIYSNNLISKRIIWLQKMAINCNYFLLKLHYYLIIKVIYGIIYR